MLSLVIHIGYKVGDIAEKNALPALEMIATFITRMNYQRKHLIFTSFILTS